MADPRPAAPSGADDDARIEHLLVTGLDHYFAGEFEPAINLWTRVLFLDRTHDRARAYIERARSAQAVAQWQKKNAASKTQFPVDSEGECKMKTVSSVLQRLLLAAFVSMIAPAISHAQPAADAAKPIPPIPGLKTWTDDYSNLYRILR